MTLKERMYLITYNQDYYRKGKIANVIGIKKVTKFKTNLIAIANFSIDSVSTCYHIQFEDGEEDYVDFNSIKENDWHFVTLEDLLRVGMP